jgi:F-box and leucine-rich repeat protein GRR1
MLTDTALDCVAKLGDHLDVLIIAHVSNVTDRGVVKIARECINLRIVDVACKVFSHSSMNNFTDCAVQSVGI